MTGRPEPDRIAAEYEQWLHSWGASDKTIKARARLARRTLGEFGLEGFTPGNLAEYLGRPTPRGTEKSRWTKATYYANLKSLCEWLVAAEYLDESPLDHPHMKRPRKPKGLPRPLTESQVTAVMRKAEGRTRTWLLLAMHAGLRAHEIAKIRGEDVGEEGIFVRGKDEKLEILPCHPELLAESVKYPPSGYWFPNGSGGHVSPDVVTVGVGRLFDTLGIEGSVHRMRHVYGTRLLRQGVNIRKVQRLMRHGALETTALYTAVDEDELRDAIYLLPSVGDDPPPAA